MVVVMMLCVVMVFINHPMFMVGGLIMLTFFIGFISYFSLFTFWYGNLILLVILSGMLVIFTYMSSLTPNEGFFFDYWGVFVVVFLASGEMSLVGEEDHSVIPIKLWASVDGIFSLFAVGLLLMAMLVVVWVGSYWKGPIRI